MLDRLRREPQVVSSPAFRCTKTHTGSACGKTTPSQGAPQPTTVPANCRLTRSAGGRVRAILRAPAAHRRTAALALSLAGLSALAAGCGQPKVQEQDKDEPAGNYPVRLVSASFPKKQNLAKDSSMTIAVENAGTQRVPNINVTVKCPGVLRQVLL